MACKMKTNKIKGCFLKKIELKTGAGAKSVLLGRFCRKSLLTNKGCFC